jgi:hypothetical protein
MPLACRPHVIATKTAGAAQAPPVPPAPARRGRWLVAGAALVGALGILGTCAVQLAESRQERSSRERGSGSAIDFFATPAPSAPPGTAAPPERVASPAAAGALQVAVTQAGAPLGGAEVRAYLRRLDGAGGAWRLAGTGTTGADGIASLPATPGAYAVFARAPGFGRGHATVIRPAGESSTRAALALLPSVELRGKVVARGTGEPVALAAVEILPDELSGPGAAGLPDEERGAGAADAAGRFRFAVAPGAYVLEARAAGYARARASAVAPGAIEVTLAAGAVIEGFVRGPDGAPAPDAEVLLSGRDLSRGTTNAAGGFAVELEPGTYAVTARTGRAAGAWPTPVVLAAGGRARGIEIRLSRPGSIAGIVTGADGAPIARATVAVSPHEGAGDIDRAESDAEGRFGVDALGAGVYDVAVGAEGWTPAVRRGVAVLAGERVELPIVLEGSGGVEGAITDGGGRALPGVRVRARRWAATALGPVEAETLSDAAGRYRLAPLDAGNVEVSAVRDPAQSGVSAWADVLAGSLARVDLILAEPGTLEGLVSRRDRGPVGRATVLVLPRGSPFPSARVEVDGQARYKVQLPAGEYSALAAPGVAGDAAPRDRPVPVRVVQGQTSQLDLVLGAAARTPAIVRVVEPGGVPSAGTLVIVTTADDLHGAGSAMTDEEGVARLEVDAPGPLHARALRGGRMGGPVPLAPSGPTAVTLQAPAHLRGRVVALDGPLTTGFTLEVAALSEDASVAATLGGAAGRRSAHGVEAPRRLEFGGERFEIPDAPAGPVRLTVRTSGGRSGHAEVVLAAGGAHEVQVLLDPGANVAGRAIDVQTRRPIAGASVLVLGERRPRAQATTGGDGAFRLSGLPAGPRRLRLVAPGYAAAERDAQLEPSGDLDVGDVALVASAAVPAAR